MVTWWCRDGEDEPALSRNYFLGGGSFSNTRFSSYDVNLPVEYVVEVKL